MTSKIKCVSPSLPEEIERLNQDAFDSWFGVKSLSLSTTHNKTTNAKSTKKSQSYKNNVSNMKKYNIKMNT